MLCKFSADQKVSESLVSLAVIAVDVALYYGNDQIIALPISHLSLLIKVSGSRGRSVSSDDKLINYIWTKNRNTDGYEVKHLLQDKEQRMMPTSTGNKTDVLSF